jgi:hypothetical protein
VSVERPGALPEGPGVLCLLALGPAAVNGRAMAPQDLMLDCGAALVTGPGPVLAIRLFP